MACGLPPLHLAERAERRPHLVAEDQRLLPGREVAALGDLVEVDEVGIGLLDPAPRRLICLAGEDAHGHRNGDAFGVPKAALVFPIEPRRRNPRVRQPKERDVVEDVVTRSSPVELVVRLRAAITAAAGWPPPSSWSRSQAAKPTGESAIPYRVCGRAAMYLA